MAQPSTLPAESLFKGFIRAYYVGTHTADIQLAASPRETIDGVRVATHIHAADAVVDRECTVLFFGAANCQDAVLIGVQGALPSGGGGGVTDHGALTGLGDDDHAQYALLAGRSTDQTLKGATGAYGTLTLQSTDHANRGFVRAQDDLQLLSNILRDAAGTTRVHLAATTPHVTITGDLAVPATGIFGPTPDPTTFAHLKTGGSLTPDVVMALHALVEGAATSGWQGTYGVRGQAIAAGSPTTSEVYGLYFSATHQSPNLCEKVLGIYVQNSSTIPGSGTLTQSAGIYVQFASWGGSKPYTTYGIYVDNQGTSGVTYAYGLQIVNQTGTVVRLLEIGPDPPYLRLLGGAKPAANQTNLYLAEGTSPTLRRVQWKLFSALVAADKVMVLV